LGWWHGSDNDNGDQARARVNEISLPPTPKAALLVHYLQDAGLRDSGAAGMVPLSPQTLTAWAQGTCTDLGPIDYQDILDASRVYVSAYHEYNGKPFPPPWEPDMTPEQVADAIKAQQRAMDRAMGLVG
jgi:hypothetical protein